MNVFKLEIKSSEILMADIILGTYGSEFICSLQFWKWIMLQSIAKVFEFCDLYCMLKKNFHDRDWISGCMKVNFKDKILKFSWYNVIKVSFPVGSMCKYSLNSY